VACDQPVTDTHQPIKETQRIETQESRLESRVKRQQEEESRLDSRVKTHHHQNQSIKQSQSIKTQDSSSRLKRCEV
jgi:hypothetical protein